MEENKLIFVLSRHWSKCLLGLLLISGLTVVGIRLINAKQGDKKYDFSVAKQIFDRFQEGEPMAIESLDLVEKILRRRPELHPQYDAPLALTFFSVNKVDKGKEYAQLTLANVKNDLPAYYHSFAMTTILIAEEKYGDALAAAQNLEESLKGKKEFEMLAGFNLLRLIFLAEKNHQPALKQRCWLALKQHSSFPTVASLFHEGDLTLTDFMEKGACLSET